MIFANDDAYLEERPLGPAASKTAWIIFGVLIALLVAAYFNMLQYASTYWNKGLYSHGWIVPLIAGYLFSLRRKPLLEASNQDRWIGVGLLIACLALRTWAANFDYNNPERASFLGALLACCLIVGGRSMLIWAGPALAFLVFMFPLPNMLENTMLIKLQNVATIISTWTLQLLGIGAARSGNVISIDNINDLTVAEACSGLRMLTIFCAMAVALVMIIDRPWWDKLFILVMAVPIAIISNVIRIVTTGLLLLAFGEDTPWLNTLIHDWAGFAMMPIGLGLLWILLTILSHLTIPVDSADFGQFGATAAPARPAPPREGRMAPAGR